MRVWLLNVLIALDQFINALCGGWPDETISARAFRESVTSRGWRAVRWLIDVAFLPIERDHCRAAFYAEAARSQLPEAYRRD